MNRIPIIALIVTAVGVLATPAFAHKGLENHTHCTVDDKGVAVAGKTDAERKASCGKIAGALWDDTKVVPVDADASAKASPPPPK